MPTLAPKLPWQHPFAGGYPGRSGQYLPVDADAIDYLSRLAEADGAAVEVGIAQAIDAFVRGCKADSAGYAGDPTRSNWDAIQASCIMCGARTLSGALVPLKGGAATGYNFVSGDYSRTLGLKDADRTAWLSVPAPSILAQSDAHLGLYVTEQPTLSSFYAAASTSFNLYHDAAVPATRSPINNTAFITTSGAVAAGTFVGTSRASSSGFTFRLNGTNYAKTATANVAPPVTMPLYGYYAGGSDARLAFYTLGTSVDLAALDARVTTLVSQIAAAIP